MDSREIIERIGIKRFEHSKRVAKKACELAKIHGINLKKAYIASMWHDCAKVRDEEIFLLAEKYDFFIDDEMKKSPAVIHSHLGAKIAQLAGISDMDILNAIKYHTTGRANMSDLEKVVFLADYTEPNRDFPQVDTCREICKIDLDRAMLFALENTIIYLIKNGQYVAVDTFIARNYFLEKVWDHF